MLKMLKHMKKYMGSLAVIVLLLVAQAVCDLWLPTYTAAIVDVGIQQGGIENSVPEILRESTLAELTLWMPLADVEKVVEPSYPSATAEDAQKLGVTATGESLRKLVKGNAKTMDELNGLFTDALMARSMLDGTASIDLSALLNASGSAVGSSAPGGEQPDREAVKAHLLAMSNQQRQQLMATAKEKLFAILPQSTLEQAAISAVQAEYQALGIDTGALRSASIWKNGGWMLLIALIGAGAAVAVGYFGSRTAAGLGRDLRGLVFHRVLRFGQQEMDGFSIASLITRSTNDIQQVQTVMVMLLRMVIYAPIIGVGGVLRALDTNASMAWVIALGVGAVVCIVLVLMAVGLPRFKRIQTQLDQVNRVMRETLAGLPVIRAFCTQRREEERFDDASKALTKTQLFVGRLMSGMMPLMMLVMNGVAVLILWNGAHGVDAGAMQVGDVMAYIQYTMQIIMAFLMISMMSLMLPRASVAAERIQQVLDTPVSVDNPAQPQPFDEALHGTVEFRDVCFRYPGAEEDMLSHISFTALPGQTTAILGGTGSGKSTLVNLIPRFYDATSGQVLVDGLDVRQASLEALRDRIGYVPQKGVLFHGTIRENLTFGSTDIPRERVEQAAQIAQAEGFILERPEGYESEIAQGGTNVSGGQRQRLSIARAIAKNPEIDIFDDSFSALDFKTDAALRGALHQATENAALLIVAQRISTVMHAEQILVLDEGRLVGRGTHRELMEGCEVYRQIALSQLSKEELEDAE